MPSIAPPIMVRKVTSGMIKMIRCACIFAALLSFTGCVTASKPRSLADGKSHFASFGTNQVHYVTIGKGKTTIVFVHCWAGNLGFWREQVPALADKARLVFIDLPGHGQSDKPQTAYTMDFFASAVLAVMRDAHVDKAILAGHSMGGAVICRVYQQAPEKVTALVSVDGLLRRPQGTPEQAAQMIGQFRVPEYRENTKRYFGNFFPIPGTEALRDQVISEMLTTPQYVMVSAMEGMFGSDQPDWDLKKVNVPVLVLNAKSPLWNDDYEKYVHSLSTQNDYRLFDGVGHWLMLEKPAEFNAALIEMLQKFDLIAK
jgi:pimeloyl-ACP methyl ester carboxylesterase